MSSAQESAKNRTETAAFFEQRWGKAPRFGLVLGSGLGGLAPSDGERVPYTEVPHFPALSVAGHKGEVVFDRNQSLICLDGRLHCYEGVSLREVVFSVESLASWGVKLFILTNSAGAINVDLAPGDIMLISDHLNLMGESPLAGPLRGETGSRFVDLTDAYCRDLRKLALQSAEATGVPLKRGVYAAVRGPNYETPAEVRMLRALGADAVGMSTVPEVIALRWMGCRVLGLSCITNMAAGTLPTVLNHDDVLRRAAATGEHLSRLTRKIILSLLQEEPGNS